MTADEATAAWAETLPATGYSAVLAGDAAALETQLSDVDLESLGWPAAPVRWHR